MGWQGEGGVLAAQFKNKTSTEKLCRNIIFRPESEDHAGFLRVKPNRKSSISNADLPKNWVGSFFTDNKLTTCINVGGVTGSLSFYKLDELIKENPKAEELFRLYGEDEFPPPKEGSSEDLPEDDFWPLFEREDILHDASLLSLFIGEIEIDTHFIVNTWERTHNFGQSWDGFYDFYVQYHKKHQKILPERLYLTGEVSVFDPEGSALLDFIRDKRRLAIPYDAQKKIIKNFNVSFEMCLGIGCDDKGGKSVPISIIDMYSVSSHKWQVIDRKITCENHSLFKKIAGFSFDKYLKEVAGDILSDAAIIKLGKVLRLRQKNNN